MGIHYLFSNCLSVLVGIIASFLLNRSYNFRVKDKVAQRFALFLLVGLLGMLFSNVILYVAIDQIGMRQTISKLLSVVLVVLFQFLLNKYITFKKS